MYERNRSRNFNSRGSTRIGRGKRSRERTPPRQRSPLTRDRSRPRFERNRSHDKFHRRSKDRLEPRFERARSNERFEPPHKPIDEPARFEPPPREIIERPRSFENERYVPPSPRFEERIEVVEPPMIERNLSFECPADYPKFPVEGRYYEGSSVNNTDNIPSRPLLESAPSYTPLPKEDNNDKPDPWSSGPASTSQLQPTFGQEKGSNLIPEFDPETSNININAFLRLIDKIGQEKSWSGHDRKFQFSMKLRGAAKDWFLNGNKFLDSWSSIKKQFRASFPADMDYHCLLTNMIQRTKRPDEDLSSYFNYKIVLLKNCNITGRKAVSCLIGGLPDTMADIKTNAMDRNFATAEELYKYLIDENVEELETQESNSRKCNSCGKRGNCECRHSEPKTSLQEEGLLRSKAPFKCYKDVYIAGKKLKCLYDEEFPHITVRESDIDFLKIRYRRQITKISGYDRSNITALGQTQLMIRVDNLFTEMPFYVVKDNIQDTPVVLGRVALKFPHTMSRNGIYFTADEKPPEFEDRPEPRDRSTIDLTRDTRSPIRRSYDHEMSMRRSSLDRNIIRSPRHSPPGRAYKETSLFVSQFYGNPYA